MLQWLSHSHTRAPHCAKDYDMFLTLFSEAWALCLSPQAEWKDPGAQFTQHLREEEEQHL